MKATLFAFLGSHMQTSACNPEQLLSCQGICFLDHPTSSDLPSYIAFWSMKVSESSTPCIPLYSASILLPEHCRLISWSLFVIGAIDKISGVEPSLCQVFHSYLNPYSFPSHFSGHVLNIKSCLNCTQLKKKSFPNFEMEKARAIPLSPQRYSFGGKMMRWEERVERMKGGKWKP